MTKQPWRAVFLSSLLPGTGQIYAGARLKGMVFIFIFSFLILSFFVAFGRLLVAESGRETIEMLGLLVFSVIALVIFSLINLFDAHWTARKFNKTHQVPPTEKPKKDPWLAVFLSKLFPGIGHFYGKKILKGCMLIVLYFLVVLASAFNSVIMLGLIPVVLFMYKDAFESAEKINGSDNKFFLQLGKLPLVLVLATVTIQAVPFGPIVKTHFVEAFKIPSASMTPSIQIGDHILVNKTITPLTLKRGDVIVFKYPKDRNKNFIKRIVALGGETIEGKDKTMYINGVSLDEPYARYMDTGLHSRSFGPIQVPVNSFFVLGDNRDNSMDSRNWGAIPANDVIGRAFKIYWSWDAVENTVRWDRIGTQIN